MAQISSVYQFVWGSKKEKKNLKTKAAKKRAKMPYKYFLQSAYWQLVREAVLARDEYRCSRCGSKTHLQIHHLTYKFRGDELNHLGCVVTLCRACHEKEHAGKEYVIRRSVRG